MTTLQMMFKDLQRIMLHWWARLAVFLLLFTAFGTIFSFIFPNDELFLYGYLVAVFLFASLALEGMRLHNKPYLFGVMFNSFTLREWLFGFAIAASNIGIILLFASMSYPGEISFEFEMDTRVQIFFVNVLLAASFEELLFRGVIFQTFFERFGKYITVLIFSIIFASLHLIEYASVLFTINIFLASVLMSIMYLQTRSLWLPISYHYFWNLLQSLFLASPISGKNVEVSFVNMDFTLLNETIFGGMFGIEGGLLATVVLLIDIFLVLKFAKIAPQMNAKLFKRYYAESELFYNKDNQELVNNENTN